MKKIFLVTAILFIAITRSYLVVAMENSDSIRFGERSEFTDDSVPALPFFAYVNGEKLLGQLPHVYEKRVFSREAELKPGEIHSSRKFNRDKLIEAIILSIELDCVPVAKSVSGSVVVLGTLFDTSKLRTVLIEFFVCLLNQQLTKKKLSKYIARFSACLDRKRLEKLNMSKDLELFLEKLSLVGRQLKKDGIKAKKIEFQKIPFIGPKLQQYADIKKLNEMIAQFFEKENGKLTRRAVIDCINFKSFLNAHYMSHLENESCQALANFLCDLVVEPSGESSDVNSYKNAEIIFLMLNGAGKSYIEYRKKEKRGELY